MDYKCKGLIFAKYFVMCFACVCVCVCVCVCASLCVSNKYRAGSASLLTPPPLSLSLSLSLILYLSSFAHTTPCRVRPPLARACAKNNHFAQFWWCSFAESEFYACKLENCVNITRK